MANIKFGTDGWRAVIAEDFTFANVVRVSQATADYWSRNPVAGTEKKVIVGYDRRFFSDKFAECAAEVLAGNGFTVVLTREATPTPSVSFAVKKQRAVGGVMITASHNPPAFNGFKLKSHFGGPAESSTCQGIEALLDTSPVRRDALLAGSNGTRRSASLPGRGRAAARPYLGRAELPLGPLPPGPNCLVTDIRPAHFAAVEKLGDFKLIARSRL